MPALSPTPHPAFLAELIEHLDDANVEDANGDPVVAVFDEDRNFFVQFAPGDSDGEVLCELVGPRYLAPRDQFTGAHLDLLMASGWLLAEPEGDALVNHVKLWDTAFISLEEIVAEAAALACHIFNSEGAGVVIETKR